jgi:hypothetical protein
MQDEALRIITELRAAFPSSSSLPLPLIKEGTTIFDDEVREVEAFFTGKLDWTRLASSDLDGVPSALTFLSDEAACFFLPAYLVADLRQQLANVDPAFELTRGLDGSYRSNHSKRGPTDEEIAKRRWRRLTARQCGAVASYLKYRTASSPIEEPAIDTSLRSYWLPRAQEQLDA